MKKLINTFVLFFVYILTNAQTFNADSTFVFQKDSIKKNEAFFEIGYGKISLNSIAIIQPSIRSEDFNKGNIVNPYQLFQSKIAGLTIATPDGYNPNGIAHIRMRGISTFEEGSPMIVIDGVANLPLSILDFSDIESVTVLKDGTSCAIYGVQGAQGVILITTKKNTKNKFSVTYNTQLTFESLVKAPSVLNAQEFLNINSQNGASLKDIDFGSRTDWYDQITRNTTSQVHNLFINGQLGKGGYWVSLNWRNQQGIIYDGFKQQNARLGLNQSLFKDKLNVSIDFSAIKQNQIFIAPSLLFLTMLYNPTAPVYDSNNSKYGGYFQKENFFFLLILNLFKINHHNWDLKKSITLH